ncbi:MAG: sigma-54-dependent Fis family transcriptional regulator, partial [Chitinophagaceae bacterium]|nr:sigma-54-dependent Fis family transcriptional regulator [Chitinophagaceae bacterium]
ELKKMFLEILQNPSLAGNAANFARESLLNEPAHHMNGDMLPAIPQPAVVPGYAPQQAHEPVVLHNDAIHHHVEVEESLNIMDKEKELIIKALKKHRGRRKDAAADLGISERTLYRKLKEYDIEE